jgi:DNA topoisomerase I
MDCNFRIGNDRYTRDNNSFGVSTLTCKHVKRKKNMVLIDFIGKKGVRNTCVVKNKKIRNNLLTQKKKKQSDDRIFIHDGVEIKSTDVNEYLKQLGNYTTKNFRTWGANTELIRSLLDDNDLTESVDMVAQKLHHTSAICKKNYIDPKLIQFYERNEKKFKTYFRGDVNKRFTQFLSENY